MTLSQPKRNIYTLFYEQIKSDIFRPLNNVLTIRLRKCALNSIDIQIAQINAAFVCTNCRYSCDR